MEGLESQNKEFELDSLGDERPLKGGAGGVTLKKEVL